MASKQVLFFATQADMRSVLKSFEESKAVYYYEAGSLDKESPASYDSLQSQVGTNGDYKNNNVVPSYLVLDKGSSIQVRPVSQRDGSMRYIIDQQKNPFSIYLRPAAINTARQSIIEGKAGTISADKGSNDLLTSFSKALKSQFLKVKGYFIGKEAYELYKQGWRLTQDVNAPTEYDLIIE